MKTPRHLDYAPRPERRSPNWSVWAWILLIAVVAVTSLIILFFARHKGFAGLICAAFVAAGMGFIILPGLAVKVWVFFNWPMSEMDEFDDVEGLWIIRLLGVLLIGLAGLLAYVAW